MITYPEALVVGLLQGVTELFPVSSLGHSVLIPALIGGRWARDLNVSAAESPYLAFIVGLHVATAIALIVYFWRDWLRIVRGFVSSIRNRRIDNSDERLAWMIIVATIPVGLAGLVLEHAFRTILGKPAPAAVFLMINGAILYGAERLRRRAEQDATSHRARAVPITSLGNGTVYASSGVSSGTDTDPGTRTAIARPNVYPEIAGVPRAHGNRGIGESEQEAVESDRRITKRTIKETTLIGSAQVLALLPGISRSGVTMAAGLRRGLSHEDAARFSFLLATPVILAAGVLKLPDLTGPLGHGIGGQVIVGSLASGIGAYAAVRWLTRYFQTRTLTPFAIYCAVAGFVSLAWLAIR
jgi:undecaprenyl-diphosphatase